MGTDILYGELLRDSAFINEDIWGILST